MTERAVYELFSDALDCAGDEREAYLLNACGVDPELLAEVRRLLAAHARAGGFLEPGAGAPADRAAALLTADVDGDHPPADPLLGRRLGAFRLTRLLGVGGMARVYLGEREGGPFPQRVAVKVMLLGAFDLDLQRRFRNECRALARLEHPNITRLIDGGMTPEGLPFLAMEYVDGTPLDRYCAERRLPLRARLRLFQDVCAAVEHSHRHSILHRDIKPGNILVDAAGCPKLADFGIARILDAVDDGDATVTRIPVMTPRYASPEQLQGGLLSTASDVYSLGLVLYRLLTGTLPYADGTGSVQERERRIASTIPLRPSEAIRRAAKRMAARDPEGDAVSDAEGDAGDEAEGKTEGKAGADARADAGADAAQAREVSGDLDAIVLMALRPEPERRYPSARQLADDLERFLRGLPVSARPDSLRYRAGKLLRRHAVATVAAAVTRWPSPGPS